MPNENTVWDRKSHTFYVLESAPSSFLYFSEFSSYLPAVREGWTLHLGFFVVHRSHWSSQCSYLFRAKDMSQSAECTSTCCTYVLHLGCFPAGLLPHQTHGDHVHVLIKKWKSESLFAALIACCFCFVLIRLPVRIFLKRVCVKIFLWELPGLRTWKRNAWSCFSALKRNMNHCVFFS